MLNYLMVIYFVCFKSRIINIVACGTFAVYLVSTKQFGPLQIGTMGLSAYEEFSYIGLIIYFLLAVAVLYIPCSVICWACSKIPMPKFLTRLSENNVIDLCHKII